MERTDVNWVVDLFMDIFLHCVGNELVCVGNEVVVMQIMYYVGFVLERACVMEVMYSVSMLLYMGVMYSIGYELHGVNLVLQCHCLS